MLTTLGLAPPIDFVQTDVKHCQTKLKDYFLLKIIKLRRKHELVSRESVVNEPIPTQNPLFEPLTVTIVTRIIETVSNNTIGLRAARSSSPPLLQLTRLTRLEALKPISRNSQRTQRSALQLVIVKRHDP